MSSDIQSLMHTKFILWFLVFFEDVGGQIWNHVECLMHILKCKCYTLIGFGFLKVWEIEC